MEGRTPVYTLPLTSMCVNWLLIKACFMSWNIQIKKTPYRKVQINNSFLQHMLLSQKATNGGRPLFTRHQPKNTSKRENDVGYAAHLRGQCRAEVV